MGTTESIFTENEGENDSAPANNVQDDSSDKFKRSTGKVQSLRRRARAQNVSSLHGIVIGLPSTGKKSLLQRLAGRDPFSQEAQGEKDCKRIVIPYKAPGGTSGERIQLSVEVSSTFEELPDFYVAMINPRHDPRSLKPYLMKLLKMLIKAGSSKALSVCILINFRDEYESRPVRVSEVDVKEWIIEEREQSSSVMIPLIETGVVSMKNCYGLLTLHHFIYRAFLYRKQRFLEGELRKVSAEMDKSQKLPTQTYEEFLDILNGSTGEEEKKIKSKKQFDETVSSKIFPKKSQPETLQASDSTQKSGQEIESVNKNRQIYSFNKPPTHVNTKVSLDEFFADDDDDDIDNSNITLPSHQESRREKQDDFYYDEDGERMSSSDREESEDEELSTLPKRTRLKQSVLEEAREVKKETVLQLDAEQKDRVKNLEKKSQSIELEKASSKDRIYKEKGGERCTGDGDDDDDGLRDDDDSATTRTSKSESKEYENISEDPRSTVESVIPQTEDTGDGWGDDDLSFDDDENSEGRVSKEALNQDRQDRSRERNNSDSRINDSMDSSESVKSSESQVQKMDEFLDRDIEGTEDECPRHKNVQEQMSKVDKSSHRESFNNDTGHESSQFNKPKESSVLPHKEIENRENDDNPSAPLGKEIKTVSCSTETISSEKNHFDEKKSKQHEQKDKQRGKRETELEDSEDDDSQIASVREIRKESNIGSPHLIAPSTDNNSTDSIEQDGWGDEDIDFDDEESIKNNTRMETIDAVQKPETAAKKSGKIFRDSDSEEDYMIGVKTGEPQIDSDVDNGDSKNADVASPPPTSRMTEITSQPLDGKTKEETIDTNSVSEGLSVAALSAIQAAQEQAHLMLDAQEQNHNEHDSPKKKKKKKEKKEKKKKKKRSKSSKSDEI